MKSQVTDVEQRYEEDFKRSRGNGLKTLFFIYKGSYGKLIGSAIAFAIKHSPCWILPIVTANIINLATGLTPAGRREIILNAVGIAVLLILNVPFNYLHVHLYSKAVRKSEAGLRLALVTKLQHLSISYHKETQSGRLQSKLMRDIEQFQTLSEQLFVNMVMIILTLAFTISVTLSKSIVVFVFFVLAVPVAVLIMMLFRKNVKKKNKEFRTEMENTSAKIIEMVELIPVARAHALENWEVRRMSKQIDRVRKKGYELDTFQALFGSVSWLTFQLFQVVCLVFTGILAYKKVIPVGDVVLYQSYFSTIVGSITTLISLIPIIAKGLESVSSIGDVLLSDDIERNSGKKKLQNVKGEYDFKDVRFHYSGDEKEILKGLNLHVNAGETIALVGESGAGKSTILNLVIGFNQPTGGTLTVDGNDITEIDLHSYRKHIAVVPQTPIVFTGSLRDNITYGMENVDENDLKTAVEAACLTDLIESLPDGLDTTITEHGANLSGGQRQRISIARAIIRDPEVIVLDEATSALDSVSEQKIQQALNHLTEGRTTFIVAHRLSTVRDADRIAVMENGVCAEIGTFDELMEKKGAFYRYKMLQS